MPSIGISETQFVFAFFYHYANTRRHQNFDFIFPSLLQEGNPSHFAAGADLVVDRSLYFQFKMPFFLKTRGAKEVKEGWMPDSSVPYFRFTVKNDPPSFQFNTLLNAAKNPLNLVRYIAPLFSNQQDFYKWFRSPYGYPLSEVFEVDFRQFQRMNLKLGPHNYHRICYNRNSAFLFSEKYNIEHRIGLQEIIDDGDQKLVFIPDKRQENLEKVISDVKIDFELKDVISTKVVDVQRELITRYGIYWVPVIREGG